MTNVLLVTSSPRGEASYSTQVATELAQKITGANITTRELWREPLPHITPEYLHASFTPADNRTDEQKKLVAISDGLIEEIQAADIVIVAAGMINFGVPSTLKSWIDYITRAGLTFRYGEAGPEGLIKGKRTAMVLATGGVYSNEAMAPMDHLGPQLHVNLSFIGLTVAETILIAGTAMGPEATEKALAEAREKLDTVAVALTN